MSKKLSPLSWKLKLVLVYIYLTLIGGVLEILGYLFISDQMLELTNPAFQRSAVIISSAIIAGVAAWAAFCIHKRSNQSTFAYVLMTVVSYAIYANIYAWSSHSVQSLGNSIYIAIGSVVDIAIVIFMFKSSDVKNQLNE